jgi:hypothetical protein
VGGYDGEPDPESESMLLVEIQKKGGYKAGGTIPAQRPVVAFRGINGFQFPQIRGNDKLKGIHAA